MSSSNKLVFFGNERLATAVTTTAPTLKKLVEAGYEITTVIASHIDSVSRQKRPLEIGPVAQAFNIPVILPGKRPDLAEKLRNHQAEAAVLVAYGQIIPQAVIDLFPGGIINIHPSLLPKYRGPTPIEMAILSGDKETGVSLMKLAAKMDAGPVYAQQTIALSGKETKQELADKLIEAGGDLLIDKLPAILDGTLTPTPQDEAGAIYTALLDKSLADIDLSLPAEIIERQVRAYAGLAQSRVKIEGHEVIVIKARVAKDKTDGALVLTAKPGYLAIEELIAPSGRTMSGADYLRGYDK